MSRWLLALLLAVAASPLAEARDTLGAIDQCLAQLDRSLDVGYQRIAARCPDLGPSLATSPWAPWLPPEWNKPGNHLSAGGLEELRTLLEREANRPPAVSEMRVDRVRDVLAALTPAEQPRSSWWSRFKQWLRQVLERRPPPGQARWLQRWLQGVALPQSALRAIVWGALGVVVALAGAIVVNELRIAGVLKDRRRASTGRAAGGAPQTGLTLADIDQAIPSEQPKLLLELLAARLGEQQRLPPARALTLRELIRAARLPQEADRARLTELAVTCERLRFAEERGIAPQMLSSALARGRELLASLDAPRAAQGTA